MKEQWKIYAARIDALSLRERVMVFVAAVFVVVYILFALMIEPAQKREKLFAAQALQQQTELQALQQQVQVMGQRLADPDGAARTRRDELQAQISGIDDSLRSMQQSLVPAQRMNTLLQSMLARNPRLQLVSMRTLPLSTLVEKRAATPASPDAPAPQSAQAAQAAPDSASGEGNVFKHGVEVRIAGSYADLYDYLTRLEKLPAHMFWSRAKLEASNYPRVTLTVTIYTLSLDKAWLQV